MNTMWMQSTIERERQDSLAELEKTREKRKQEQQAKEDIEWEQNQAEFLKKRVKSQEQRISELEGMVVQLVSHLEKESDGKWKFDWNNI